MSVAGIIYNIQRYSLQDGPGIRTVVFFKGCPLRCRWCCNPESHNPQPELFYARSKCIGSKTCGRCRRLCRRDAVSYDAQGYAVIDRNKCSACLCCVENCPAKAIQVEGSMMTVEEILCEVEKESVFYRSNIGGLTVSGGEPLLQGIFLLTLLQEAKERRISTAIETCGFGDYEILKQAAQLSDTVLYDIKSLDERKHQEWTMQDNQLILENFRKLCVDFPSLPIIVRTPLIPGFNDSDEETGQIRSFLKDKSNVNFEILSYHKFGISKYAALGREYPIT